MKLVLLFLLFLISLNSFSMGQKPQTPKPTYSSVEDCIDKKIRGMWAEKGGFKFSEDTFSFRNWSNGNTGTANCWGWSALQRKFFFYAHFDPTQPKITDMDVLADLVHNVSNSVYVTIPGYANLKEFSKENEALLKDWVHREWLGNVTAHGWTYLGHVFGAQMGMSKREVANSLKNTLHMAVMPLVVMFTKVKYNHVIMAISYRELADGVTDFWMTDSNYPDKMMHLYYHENPDLSGDGYFQYTDGTFNSPDITIYQEKGWGDVVGANRQVCQREMSGNWQN